MSILELFGSITVIRNNIHKVEQTRNGDNHKAEYIEIQKMQDLKSSSQTDLQGGKHNFKKTAIEKTKMRREKQDSLRLCCCKWDFQCGWEWNHDPKTGLWGSHPDVNMWEDSPGVGICVCVCVWWVVCTQWLHNWDSSSWERGVAAFWLLISLLSRAFLSSTGFDPKEQSTATHNIHTKTTIYRQ